MKDVPKPGNPEAAAFLAQQQGRILRRTARIGFARLGETAETTSGFRTLQTTNGASEGQQPDSGTPHVSAGNQTEGDKTSTHASRTERGQTPIWMNPSSSTERGSDDSAVAAQLADFRNSGKLGPNDILVGMVGSGRTSAFWVERGPVEPITSQEKAQRIAEARQEEIDYFYSSPRGLNMIIDDATNEFNDKYGTLAHEKEKTLPNLRSQVETAPTAENRKELQQAERSVKFVHRVLGDYKELKIHITQWKITDNGMNFNEYMEQEKAKQDREIDVYYDRREKLPTPVERRMEKFDRAYRALHGDEFSIDQKIREVSYQRARNLINATLSQGKENASV